MSLIPYSTEKQMSVLILNADGSPATGKTVNCSIRRASDGKWWEGTGSTWEVAIQNNAMSEISNGLYYYDFSSTGVGNSDDTFVVYYSESTIPAYGEEEFSVTELFTDTELIPDISDAIVSKTGTVSLTGSTTVFRTDLTEVDDFWIDLQIVMRTGSNAGQSRRISDFANTNGVITVDSAFTNNVTLNDTFIVIGRFTSPASALTPSSIAIAVWDELLAGHITASTFGVLMKDIKTVVDAINTKAGDIQTRLPATLIGGIMRSHIQGKDATLPLSAQEKIDVRTQVDGGLAGYETNGVASQNDLSIVEGNIISEIDDNEVKIDALQVDLTLLLTRLGIPPTTIYDALKAEIDANEALIITLTANLATHDTAIKALIGTPIVDLITDINNRFDTVDINIQANYDAITLIQNNVSTVLTGPKKLVRPDSGTKPYRYFVFNYDNTGNMEDFDTDPTLTGTYISGGGPYFGGTMTRDGIGQYHFDIDVAFDDVLGAVQTKLDAVVAGTLAPRVMVITSEVTDYDDELQEIFDLAQATYNKVDAGVPSPKIPAQLTAMEIALTAEIDENQTILEIIRDDMKIELGFPNPAVKNTGFSRIRTSDGLPILTGATEIPIMEGTTENLKPDGGIIIVDKDTFAEEKIAYTSVADDIITLSTPTTNDHDDFALIQEITRVFVHMIIQRHDGEANIEADEPPIYEIHNTWSGLEDSGAMAFSIADRRYSLSIDYDNETQPGERTISFDVTVDSKTRNFAIDLELIDRPASDRQIAELGGAIPPATFPFNEEGWIDESGIFHAWTDGNVGPVRDVTGKTITGVNIKAFLIIESRPQQVPNPPYDNYTDIFGTFRGALEAATYLFIWYKDGLKWKEEERTIGS